MTGVGVVAWTLIAVMAVALVVQASRWSESRHAVALQAGTPYLLLLAFPLGTGAVVARCWALVGASGVAAVALVVLAWPLRFPAERIEAPAGARRLRVFHGNLLHSNRRPDEVATVLEQLEADVLAFTEYTPSHATTLHTPSLAESFPFRIEHPEATAGGSAIWSRFPLTEVTAPASRYRSSAALINVAVDATFGAAAAVAVYVVHPPNPFVDHGDWLDELAGLAGLHRDLDGPTIVVGDLNAGYWHPPFRRLLRTGWRDAHQLVGRGFSTSWPTDRWWLPPFVRLDHALVDESLVVISVMDVDLPGGDHRGFVAVVTNSASSAAPTAARAEPAA